MKKFIFGLLTALALAGCVTAPATKESATPIAAIALSQCDKAIAVFVVVDPKTMVRFDPRQTSLFRVQPDGSVTEDKKEPTDINAAMQFALTAPIKSHAVIPCDEGART